MDNYEVARVLDDAADLLLIHGRCKGNPLDPQGRMCVRGAILSALLDDCELTGASAFCLPADARRVSSELSAYLARHPEVTRDPSRYREWFDRGSYPDWAWSDATEDDDLVIDTMRRCAKELRG